MKRIEAQKIRKLTLAEAEALAKRDRRRIIGMAVVVLVLLGTYLFGRSKEQEYMQDELAGIPRGEQEDEAQLYVPEFDRSDVLESISDKTPAARVVIDQPGLESVLKYALALTRRHYETLVEEPLDEAAREALMSAPAEHRLEAYSVRGELLTAKRRQVTGASEGQAWFGTLALDGGGFVHYFVDRSPEAAGIEAGDWARLDGLFLQAHNTEVGPVWVDAPLLVGRDLEKSYPLLQLGEDFSTPALADVRDDSLEDLSGIDVNAKWQLMAKALHGADQVDWTNAPELTAEVLNDVFVHGEKYRGQPFRIPISVNMDTRSVRVEENPLHLDRITEGWIGNYIWKGKAGTINWWAPWDRPELHDWRGKARLLTAQGFFLKNYIYMGEKQPQRAPLFIMADVQIHTPAEDNNSLAFMWGVLGLTLLFVGCFTILLMRDRKQSAELQEELLRRKRERRQRARAAAGAQLETP